MQVDFFDIVDKPEAQKMVMPWPMKFLAFNLHGDSVRIYYASLPGETEQQGTFYCVKSEQVLPETFPAQLIATVFKHTFSRTEDNAIHIFFEMPVKKPKKPHALKSSADQKVTGGEGANGGGKNGD
jgi:hypothetical protein